MSIGEKFIEVIDEMGRFENRLKEEDFSTYTMEAIDVERNELEMLWVKYKTIYEEYCSESPDKKKIYSRHNSTHKIYIRCVNLIAKVKKGFTENSSKETVVPKQNISVHVPPCDTGVFKGDYISWPSFRDLFTAIFINNTRLSSVEKLFYLFQKTDGEAREINRNVALTAENFEIAWTNLKNQYENKRVLVNTQLRRLFNMAPCHQDSFQEIKRLQREINNCMSVLKLFKVDIESWDPIFVFLCSAKLSEQTLNLWEQSIKNKTEIPKWKELDDFLTDRFHALESVSDILSTNNQWGNGSDKITRRAHQTNAKVKKAKSHHTKVDVAQCKLCKDSHPISSCYKFLNMDQKNRASTLRKFKYCFNCLRVGHMYNNCTSQNGCSKCQGKHHTLLHRDFNKKMNPSNTVAQSNSESDQPGTSKSQNIQSSNSNSYGTVQNHHTSVSKRVMLATAYVNIVHFGTIYKIRALIDPCSDESFVSERIQKLIKLPTIAVSAEVTGLGGELVSKSNKMANFTISSKLNPNISIKVEALVVTNVTGNIPTHSLYLPDNFELPNLEYADPEFYKSSQIDMLLGGNLYPTILRSGVKHGIIGSLVAQETIFGWIVTGPTSSKDSSLITSVAHFTKVSIEEQLAKFWELEEVPRKKFLNEDDKKCEEIYSVTTIRRPDGRYEVDLPFKMDISQLGLSRHIAMRQFLRNEKSLSRKPELKSLYDEVIKEYSSLSHMKEVDSNDDISSYYLPHHGVFKPESATTKLRVVFNASSPSSSGISLNDMLYIGPVLQADLVVLVLKWRFFRYVFNADISKMYRQILVNPQHTRFQRIVFRESENYEIKDYELKTVTFGVSSAPYLALRTLNKLADDEEVNFPVGAKIIRGSMYVDDVLVGTHSVAEALVAREQIIGILGTAGFELRKWTSNTSDILKDLPSDHLLNSTFLCLDDKCTAKTLGVRWNAADDFFYFTTEKVEHRNVYTKRQVLSLIARLFDPAGWLAPVIIVAKIIMQDMWLDKTEWDEEIKPVALNKWKNFITKYNEIDDIKIPRWIKFSPDCSIEYHGFCDSSEAAYAATIYVRIEISGHIYSNLLTAKSKVAPIKKLTLPRLELCGAVLLVELIDSVIHELEPKKVPMFLWSDSTIVLAWLKKPPCTWNTFVANRISRILEKVGNNSWSHVASSFNPADLATRGLFPSELKDNDLWWHGPEWLRLDKSSWPVTTKEFETKEEARRKQVFVARSNEEEDVLDRFSSMSRAIHVLAYVFRFFHRSRGIKNVDGAHKSLRLSAEELSFIRNRLFLLAQVRFFPDDHLRLSKKCNISNSSQLLTLTPFLDKNGIIRANGRLGSAKGLSYNERHPIILPYNCQLSHLYVDFVHKLTLHGGPRLVLNTIRLECWILKVKNLVKKIIRNCKECVLYKKKCQNQIMSVLPEDRVNFSRPFTNTGVDFAGPFELKTFTGRSCKITKGYTCLFVCFSTKAIHLEAVSDLSTSAFLAAFARFISRRGCPSKMYSDNGRNFVGAARQIDTNFKALVKVFKDETVAKYSHQQLSWHFIPAGAPHMGGLWEAGVKSFKIHLKKVSGQLKFTFEEFSTLLATIEACLNSRPLSSLSNDVDDLTALTPGHFLIGGPILTPAEPAETASVDSILNRWRKVKAIQSELCRRWKNEYLVELIKRNKWQAPQVDIRENDLVVIRHEQVCPTEWRLGRVMKVFRGPDDHVRVAELKTQNGLITRPIHKMVLLPRGS